jgi:hypothetical protein
MLQQLLSSGHPFADIVDNLINSEMGPITVATSRVPTLIMDPDHKNPFHGYQHIGNLRQILENGRIKNLEPAVPSVLCDSLNNIQGIPIETPIYSLYLYLVGFIYFNLIIVQGFLV